MEKKTYLEKLKDPRWQKKRLEILERDGWKCMACGDKERTLHIHHVFYLPHKEPWEIPNGLLLTMCEKCHYVKPCRDEYEVCLECPDLGVDCEGPANTPNDLIDCIASLLNEIWKSDTIGDFSASIGYIAMHIGDNK
jgi:hypothetical protein